MLLMGGTILINRHSIGNMLKKEEEFKRRPTSTPQTTNTRVGTLIVATIYLQLIQNRYMFRSFTVLQCKSPALCTTRCQRCGSRRIPLAAPVVLIVRMERSTVEVTRA